MSHHPQVDAVAALADSQLDATIELLGSYLKIPAISCLASHAGEVARLAGEVRDEFERLGFDRARLLELDGAHPCVAAEWMHAGEDKPTVLIYGHLDLQPVELENWRTDPHEPTTVGDRLYARGAADDMGGWVSHIGALRAWFEVAGGPPCNIKLIIEGEEEIGSPNLEAFMDAHPAAFESDVMVLTDCENPTTETPGLTVSLRGLLEVEVTCSALHADVHSGLWGGMVPDVSIALVRLIARLTDEDGRMAVGRVEVDDDRLAAGEAIVFEDEVIREGAHLIDGVDPLPLRDRSAAEWLWWQPSVTVVATTLPTADKKKNALRTQASATLSVRLAPDQTPEEMYAVLEEVLLADPPAGVRVELDTEDGWSSVGWLYTPKGPAFPAADRAYMKAWGKPMVQVGVGGSIPFVALFGERFGDLPLILNGVMDPLTTAHGPNESMHLGIFRKAVAANVFLLDELAAIADELIR